MNLCLRIGRIPVWSNDQICNDLIDILGLESYPVAVRFQEDTSAPEGFDRADRHRFCQVAMRARRGESLFLSPEEIACPAAAAALGFRPLLPKLQSGDMLKAFGIVRDLGAGARLIAEIPRLPAGKYKSVLAAPLEKASFQPDVVMIEDRPERLMWVALAFLNVQGGERLSFGTSVLQAMCVDSVVAPFLSEKLNMSFGCYGCRDATDISECEASLGIPGGKLHEVMQALRFLNAQAIPRSRKKGAYHALCARLSVNPEGASAGRRGRCS